MKFKQFKNFMKDRGAWKKYKKNFYKDIDNEGITPKQFWKRHLEIDNVMYFLAASFYWDRNDEGLEYWGKISDKWKAYYFVLSSKGCKGVSYGNK